MRATNSEQCVAAHCECVLSCICPTAAAYTSRCGASCARCARVAIPWTTARHQLKHAQRLVNSQCGMRACISTCNDVYISLASNSGFPDALSLARHRACFNSREDKGGHGLQSRALNVFRDIVKLAAPKAASPPHGDVQGSLPLSRQVPASPHLHADGDTHSSRRCDCCKARRGSGWASAARAEPSLACNLGMRRHLTCAQT